MRCFAAALRADPELRLIAVLPHHPDQDGRLSEPPNLVGRQQALDALSAAGPGRVAVYGIENREGTPVYVHAKVCIVDDLWASVGSDNINRRSWTHDSELSSAVIDDTRDDRAPQVVDRFGHGARRFARDLRLELAREHLDRDAGRRPRPRRPGRRVRGVRGRSRPTATLARRWTHRAPAARTAAALPDAAPVAPDPGLGDTAVPDRVRPGRPPAVAALLAPLLAGQTLAQRASANP